MPTTIQVSNALKAELTALKLYERETYDEVLWNLIEDSRELSREALALLAEAEADVAAGRLVSLDELARDLDL